MSSIVLRLVPPVGPPIEYWPEDVDRVIAYNPQTLDHLPFTRQPNGSWTLRCAPTWVVEALAYIRGTDLFVRIDLSTVWRCTGDDLHVAWDGPPNATVTIDRIKA